jgi:hypothetical protein
MTNTTDETQELSPFLKKQAEIMAARAQQDRDIEERQEHSLVPATQEAPKTKGKYVVEEFPVSTGETRTRQITPLPQPTLFQAKQITKNELSDMIAELRDEMADQQERFDNKDAVDKERTDKRMELATKIGELTRQLNETQFELDRLNRQGSVRDEFIEFAKRAEQRIVSIATGVYNFLLEKIAIDKHEASYKELTPLLSEDIRFKVDRSGVRGLTQASFARLHPTPKDQISNARVEATLEKVYTATETLDKVLEK